MKAPKLLPWIARKNEITEHVALNLWRRAAKDAAKMSDRCDSSDYFLLAIKGFIELADEEGKMRANSAPLACPPSIFSMGWLLGVQTRLFQVSLLATQKACSYWLPT